MKIYLLLTSSFFVLTTPLTAQDSVDDQHNAAKKLSMSGQPVYNKQPNRKVNQDKTVSLRTKTVSLLFLDYKEGVFTQNNADYAVAMQNESALAAAHRLKISYHKLLKYNDLQEGEPLLNYQFIYLEPKKGFFSEPEPAFFKVERDETLYEIAQFYGIRLADLQQRNGLNPGEEVANGELILLNQRAVARPKLREKDFKISAAERLQPIKVEEILIKEENNPSRGGSSTNTYPDYIYQRQTEETGGNAPQIQINVPSNNEVQPPPKSKGSVSLFGAPALSEKQD